MLNIYIFRRYSLTIVVRWYGRRCWISDSSLSLSLMSVGVVSSDYVVVDAIDVVIVVVVAMTGLATTVMVISCFYNSCPCFRCSVNSYTRSRHFFQ